jgi:hypothetical protein
VTFDRKAAKKHYEDHVVYKIVNFQLADEKLASLDAVEGAEGESQLTPEAREAIVLEITMRVLSVMSGEILKARREEAAKAITSILSASSLAEAKAKAIWNLRNIPYA